jgi:hypothetical protein
MIDIASIDRQLSQQGRFCLIDWLLADNLLVYTEYEAWRYGHRKNLDGALQLDKEALQDLIDDTEKHCRDLCLAPESQDFYRWAGDQRMLLTASENSQQNQQLTQHWLRPQDQPQLDLFMDNSAQTVENELLEALGGRQFDAAQLLLENLSKLNSECIRLGGYQDLVNYGLHMVANPCIEVSALAAELQGLRQEVRPLAQEIIGHIARDYLSFAWRRLANNMLDLPFNPNQPELHASSALLEIPDYPALIERLTADPSLYQQSILLERLAISYTALHQDENALIVWCLMMERDKDYSEAAIERYKTHRVDQLWLDFWDADDDWPREHFPAFVLAKQPALLHSLDDFPPLRQPASQAMAHLLQRRITGEDEILERKRLQQISPKLLRVYLGE